MAQKSCRWSLLSTTGKKIATVEGELSIKDDIALFRVAEQIVGAVSVKSGVVLVCDESLVDVATRKESE